MVLSLRGSRLRPIGHLSRAAWDGTLPRLGRAPDGPIGQSVIAFATALHTRVGDPDLSVVLRGSLARGAKQAADIDLMLLGPHLPDLPPRRSLPDLPLPVELGVVPDTRLAHAVQGAWPRFALAHCGWTLAGPERLAALPPPRLGPVVIAHLRGLPRWWPHHPPDWAASAARRRLISGWLAKRIIRSLAEGEMIRHRVYSRDIWPCLDLAARAFPQARADLIHIAEQAIFPSGTYPDFERITHAARPLLELASRRHLGRHITLPTGHEKRAPQGTRVA